MPLFKKRDEPGMYNGRHYTEYVEPVKALKRSGKYDEAETLLLALAEAVESEARATLYNPAPWYYDELAKIYRRNKDYAAEVDILERYERLEKKPHPYMNDSIQRRLEKARMLLQHSRNLGTS